uniref:Uncharacterized protein n=1 Tax=Salix viminalis TaxID=40686 RepID=A0A6N2K1L7_SALVM
MGGIISPEGHTTSGAGASSSYGREGVKLGCKTIFTCGPITMGAEKEDLARKGEEPRKVKSQNYRRGERSLYNATVSSPLSCIETACNISD